MPNILGLYVIGACIPMRPNGTCSGSLINKPKPAEGKKGGYCRTRYANRNRDPIPICQLEGVSTFTIAIIHQLDKMTAVGTSSSHRGFSNTEPMHYCHVAPDYNICIITLTLSYPRPEIALTT